jgi:ABC-type multidrug transport system fused ATPase/permease subunit
MANFRPVKGTLGVLRAGIALLTRKEALVMVALFGASVIVGLLDATAVTLVLPLVQSILEPELLQTSAFFGPAAAWLGFEWNPTVFPWLAGILMGLIVISAIATVFVNWISDLQSAYCRNRLGNEVMQRLLDAPYLWFLGKNSAALARLVLSDVATWRNNFLQSLLQIGQSLLLIILPSAAVIALAPSFGLIALAVVGALALAIALLIRPRIQKTAAQQKENMNHTWHELLQTLGGIREVKVSNRASFFTNRLQRHYRLGNRYMIINRFFSGLSPTAILTLGQVGFISAALVLWAAGLPGTEVTAQLAMLAVVISRVIPAINRATNSFNTLVASVPFVEGLLVTLREIDDATRNYSNRGGGEPVPRKWGVIRLTDVHFQYPGAAVASLDGLNFELERGKRYGLVGTSGAGKSTLVNLLLGLFQPTGGIISIDGKPLNTIQLCQWQERIGYVPQDVFLLDDSLHANIVFGDSDFAVNDDRLREAIHQARLAEVICSLPWGLETWMGERGRRLSGGQAQRVAIARALYRSPDIVLLDEATSALDTITEAEIQAAFDALGGNVLAIAVAHRVSSLRNCHSIILLDGGRVHDIGSYEELLERNALFRGLAANPTGKEV